MKKKSTSRSAFFSLRVLFSSLLFAAACSTITVPLLAFLSPKNSENSSQRTLTFDERVSYQRAIEEVYWRHRIWPKERPDPKPSLDAVMSEAQLEKKVTDYLRNSQALEDHWQRPITAEQLQAEMDRMANHTKQPEVLRELFEALGNDPFMIAECLARPALAERLLSNWYTFDQRIHGELRQRAELELKANPTAKQMKQLSGKCSEVELIKSDRAEDEHNRGAEHAVRVNGREWDETSHKLATTFTGPHSARTPTAPSQVSIDTSRLSAGAKDEYEALPIEKFSPLQEYKEHYYVTAVIGKTKDRLKLATVSWLKEPLESWLARAETQTRAAMTASSFNYTLPTISGGVCIDDTWTATAGPPEARSGQVAVWTGSEMIVWGGTHANQIFFNTGGRYNPSTDNWTPTSASNAPIARAYHTAVWTGSEMIVWGGYDGNELNTGGRYNPSADDWTATSTMSAPSARGSHTAAWTGSEMIVWGGYDGASEVSTGGKYDPSVDSWAATATINAPAPRYSHTTVWTGSEMIVWGGVNGGVGVNTGGKYNPGTNSWTATSTTNPPTAREFHTAVWTGSEMIIWGGSFLDVGYHYLNTGGKYNPASNSWAATSTIDSPSARASHTAVWTGSEMIIWGGANPLYFSTGGRYNPITDSWVPTSRTPDRRARHTAVWTGAEMVVWGGTLQDGSSPNSGGKYDPITDNWTTTATTNAPAGRYLHTVVWTGTEMIIWGGYSYDGVEHYWNTGSRYNPGTDSWTVTSITNAPLGRELHTAVWTGSDMIVWGGYDGTNSFNTGGRYNPGTDSWTATSTTNAPAARNSHQAVWTGSEMIAWGGGGNGYFDTGGRYDPSTNSWVLTSTTNAPTGRAGHKALWTDSEMIVWGGYFFDGFYHYLNTGGRYNPNTNSWTATAITNAPDGRSSHTVVWTGNEMIVWGGEAGDDLGYYFNTGAGYDPRSDSWTNTSIINAPSGRFGHTAVWTGNEMVVWGGILYPNGYTSTGARYCVQSSPTPTPTPCTGRCEPTPRPRPTPHVRPTPR